MPSTAPRIAIPAPTSNDLAYNRDWLGPYLTALERSGSTPVFLPLTATRQEQLELIRSCGGALLPGSPADVDPARYGQAPLPETAAADPQREQLDTVILEHASTSGIPVLGVCYGLQSVNVWRGGTLVQHLSVLPVPHTAGPAVAVAHAAQIDTTSQLAALAEQEQAASANGRLPINSSHHQAVGIVGDALRVVARCPQDGVVEAIEGDRTTLGFDLLAVQWHPERSFDHSETSRRLFAWLTAHARS